MLDTDVVLSGLRSTVGASRVLLQAVEAGVVTPLVSVATMIEYEAVLMRAEHRAAMGLTAAQVDRFLDAFVAQADTVDTHFRTRPAVRDPTMRCLPNWRSMNERTPWCRSTSRTIGRSTHRRPGWISRSAGRAR